MNFHDDHKALLSALLDGELNEAERAEALAHLDECAECRAYFAELTSLHDALGELEPAPVPEGFAAGVLARLHEEAAPQPAKKVRVWRRWGALAACAAVVVLAVTVLPNTLRMGKSADSAAQEAAMAPETENYLMSSMTADTAAESEESALDTADTNTALFSVGNTNMTAPAEPATPESAADAGSANDARAYAGGVANAKLAEGVLTLSGEGAEDWLAANGTRDETAGWYLVSVDALSELPDGLTLEGVAEPADGMVAVVAAETEAQP